MARDSVGPSMMVAGLNSKWEMSGYSDGREESIVRTVETQRRAL